MRKEVNAITGDIKKFHSPFSYRQGYRLTWKKIDTRWSGIDRPDLMQDRVKDIVWILNQLNFITSIQMAKTYWPQNTKEAKKTFSKLERLGILVRHNLKNKHKDMPFYTLGPAGAKTINIPYKPNWWLDVKLDDVLKQLIINQFFLRIYRSRNKCRFLQAPVPLSGLIVFNEMEFPLVVVRADIENIAREIRWTDVEKSLVICEDHQQLKEIAKNIKFPARFTTDYELCSVSLNQAFYRWEKDRLINDNINIFSTNA